MWKSIESAPNNKPVLVYFKDGTMEVAILYDGLGWWTNDGLDFGYGLDIPLFWCELPEPP